MGIYAPEQTRTTGEIASALNADFQFVADTLPTDVKVAGKDESFVFGSLPGVGMMWAAYGGQHRREIRDPNPAHDAIFDFVVRVGIVAGDNDGKVDFEKKFGLTYQTLRSEGPLLDMEPITPESLQDYTDLEMLAMTVRALRNEYARNLDIEVPDGPI